MVLEMLCCYHLLKSLLLLENIETQEKATVVNLAIHFYSNIIIIFRAEAPEEASLRPKKEDAEKPRKAPPLLKNVDGSSLLLEGGEAQTDRLADGVQAAVDAHPVQLLAASAVPMQALEAGGDVPDVDEGDVGEVAAPLHGDADAAAEGHDGVAQVLAAGEALVRVLPHAVHGMVAFRLGEDILEHHLKMVIDVVGVTVHQINFLVSHFERFFLRI